MTVKQLKKLLEGVDEKRIVILQKDSEGNGYSPLAGVDDNCRYDADSTWSGEIGRERLDEEDIKNGYTKEDLGRGKKALVLFPVN